MKLALALFTLPIAALGSPCSDFSGTWKGKCSTFPSEEHEVIVTQTECSFLTVRSTYNFQDVEVGATKNESTSSALQTTYKVTYYEWNTERDGLIINIRGGGKRTNEPTPWNYSMSGLMALQNNNLIYKIKNVFHASNGGVQTTENSCLYVSSPSS